MQKGTGRSDQEDEWEPWEFIDGLYNEISVTVYAKDDDCESDEDMDIPAHLMSEVYASENDSDDE